MLERKPRACCERKPTATEYLIHEDKIMSAF